MLISDDGGQFAFDKRELAVLTGVMANDDARGLAALWFHPSKAQVWATDGHRAVMVQRELEPPKASTHATPVALPAATAHHAAKTAHPRDLVVIDISGKRVAIEVREPTERGVTIESFEEIEARTRSKHAVNCARHQGGPGSIDDFFPSPRGRGNKGAVVPMNPALLAPLYQLGKLAEPSGQVWVNLGRIEDPVLFVARADAWTVWRMIVMPLRAQPGDYPDREPVQAEQNRDGRGTARNGRGKARSGRGKSRNGRGKATTADPAPIPMSGASPLRAVS